MAYSGNGTGTQSDPYQVTTIEQLVECFEIYNHTGGDRMDILVYCKLMNDLDFNDSPQYWDCPAGLFTANNTYYNITGGHHIYIDGNGFGIYNLYNFNKAGIFNTTSISNGDINYGNRIYISNCVLEAIVIYSTGGKTNLTFESNDFYDSGVFFDNCDLRIKLYKYSSEQYSSLFVLTRFNNCILNIDIVINKQGFNGYTDGRTTILSNNKNVRAFVDDSNKFRNFYNEWNIRIIFVSDAPYSDDTTSLFEYTCHFFSSFFIEMVAAKDNFVNKIKITSDRCETNINNCYFVVKNTGTTYKASLVLNDRLLKNGVNFYDSQLADGQITDISRGSGVLLALTTAQCKDAEYLEQQGFIIAK